MLLSIEGLGVEFTTSSEPLTALYDVGLTVNEGEIVGLVGESGSGKSLTSRAVMGLIPSPGRISSGRITFDGEDVLAMGPQRLRSFRAHDVGMIFQDPFTSLNPVHRVGTQLCETLSLNVGLSRKQSADRALELLGEVGLPEPERQFKAFPHQLSGGMRQRVMIALATASQPRLLLADEPTTALDVMTQKQILRLLTRMRREAGMGMLLVSHDFGVIAQTCDRVLVMYGGHIVESGTVQAVYDAPQHPYTRALLASVPELESVGRRGRRDALPGKPPELGQHPDGCVFHPRCRFRRDECSEIAMQLLPVGGEHQTACPFERTTTEQAPAIATEMGRR